MWIKNFFNELKVWREIRKVYKENKESFLEVGLKMDWVGHIYKVINRDVSIPLGSPEDEKLLRDELNGIQKLLVEQNVIDILAYELKPLEADDGKTYEHAYLITFTPAYSLDKQYVTTKSVVSLILAALGIIGGAIATIIHYV